MIEAIRDVFPKRRVKLVRSGIVQWVRSISMLLLSGGLVFGWCWWLAGSLVNDLRVAYNPERVAVAKFDGECALYGGGVIFSCSGTIISIFSGKKIANTTSSMWLDIPDKQYNATIWIAKGEPETLTLGENIDKIWHRVIFWLLGCFLLMVPFGLGLKLMRNSIKAGKMEGLAHPMVPIAMALISMSGSTKARTFTIEYMLPGRNKPKQTQTCCRAGEVPFALDGGRKVLGVMIEGFKLPILLDEGLQRIGLTVNERHAIREVTERFDALFADDKDQAAYKTITKGLSGYKGRRRMPAKIHAGVRKQQ